ncbi:hypothetical protein [Niveibacterium terrae]|uniref:hypothetical protein n=1 Tax=Niveibacterium terrae TaxID=3373598 RepID=UPI003A904E23
MPRIANLVRCAALSLALAAAPCFADRILDPHNPPPVNVVSLPDNRLSTDQVRGAIISGAAVHGWILKSEAAGSLVLKLEKGKSCAEIRLPYSADGYSIEYVTSSNLNYRRAAPEQAPRGYPTPGGEVDPDAKPGSISPSYTDLVDGLIRAIDARVAAIPAAH